jgi:nucleotide-binding universal stress UspA family protein
VAVAAAQTVGSGGSSGREGQRVMENADNQAAGTADAATAPLLLVVGFDASEPAMRALDAAGRLLRGRSGSIHVVYVTHPSSIADLSADAAAELEEASDEMARQVSLEARERLGEAEATWTFEHRRGDVTRQLIDAADQLLEQRSGAGYTAIVVGSSTHRIHRIVGSVPVALVRHSNVPLVVVP